jgi:hypothetical protein
LDPPGFAGLGLAGCAGGKRYIFVVPVPPVTAKMCCLAKWFDADWALFSLRPVALARSLARMVNSGFRLQAPVQVSHQLEVRPRKVSELLVHQPVRVGLIF